MSPQILALPAVAERLAAFAAAASAARDRANDPDTRGRYAGLVQQYDQLAASVHAALVTSRPVRVPAAPRRSLATAPAVGAERFWQAAGAAQRAIIDAYGLHWAVRAPIGETILVTVPPRLRSFKSERGTTIRYRADHRLPAARFWPGGEIPAVLEVTPDVPRVSAADAEAMRARADFCAAREDFYRANADLRTAQRQGWKGSYIIDARRAAEHAIAARRRLREIGAPLHAVSTHDDAWHKAHGYVLHHGQWRFPQEVNRDRALAEHERIEAERQAAEEIARQANAIGWASI
ncbi:MAG TPA: hypothetical protein VL614_15225 [Acetobacteraceae bacterium]|jgi:hypothetical protein|nr:hypothetical protein [Acetobacteraceae bacterium]